MKIYFFDVQDAETAHLAHLVKDLPCILVAEPLSTKNVHKFQDAEIISIFINTVLTAELIDLLPALKYVTTRSTGFEHIDIQAAKKRGIPVSNVPSYGENTVAEYTFALILALSRKLIQAHELMEKLEFCRTGLQGFDLKNKTLGIVGLGTIGSYAARIGHGFSMKVIAFDLHPDKKLEEQFHFQYVDSLKTLLQQSDIITLHVPYNKHTHHMINKETFAWVKPGALLINTARGGLIDTQALLWALDNNIIAAAGLDVLEGERDIERESLLIQTTCPYEKLKCFALNCLLFKHKNVIITPHNAFNTKEAMYRISQITEKNIRRFLSNNLINTVV